MRTLLKYSYCFLFQLLTRATQVTLTVALTSRLSNSRSPRFGGRDTPSPSRHRHFKPEFITPDLEQFEPSSRNHINNLNPFLYRRQQDLYLADQDVDFRHQTERPPIEYNRTVPILHDTRLYSPDHHFLQDADGYNPRVDGAHNFDANNVSPLKESLQEPVHLYPVVRKIRFASSPSLDAKTFESKLHETYVTSLTTTSKSLLESSELNTNSEFPGDLQFPPIDIDKQYRAYRLTEAQTTTVNSVVSSIVLCKEQHSIEPNQVIFLDGAGRKDALGVKDTAENITDDVGLGTLVNCSTGNCPPSVIAHRDMLGSDGRRPDNVSRCVNKLYDIFSFGKQI